MSGQTIAVGNCRRLKTRSRPSLLTRRSFPVCGGAGARRADPVAASRADPTGTLTEKSSLYTFAGNIVAIGIAFWARLSIETYPGIRRSYVIFPCRAHWSR